MATAPTQNMTKQQLLYLIALAASSGGGGGPSLDGDNTWTGANTFNGSTIFGNSATFSGGLDVNSGSLVLATGVNAIFGGGLEVDGESSFGGVASFGSFLNVNSGVNIAAIPGSGVFFNGADSGANNRLGSMYGDGGGGLNIIAGGGAGASVRYSSLEFQNGSQVRLYGRDEDTNDYEVVLAESSATFAVRSLYVNPLNIILGANGGFGMIDGLTVNAISNFVGAATFSSGWGGNLSPNFTSGIMGVNNDFLSLYDLSVDYGLTLSTNGMESISTVTGPSAGGFGLSPGRGLSAPLPAAPDGADPNLDMLAGTVSYRLGTSPDTSDTNVPVALWCNVSDSRIYALKTTTGEWVTTAYVNTWS